MTAEDLANQITAILYNARAVASQIYMRKEYLNKDDIKDIEQNAYSSLYSIGNDRLSLPSQIATNCNYYIHSYIESALENAIYQKNGNFPDPPPIKNIDFL